MLQQPKCSCLQCSYYSFVYSSVFDLHKCLECDISVQGKHLNGLLVGFSVKNSDPMLVQNYNKLYCLSCAMTGGIYFKKTLVDVVYCDLCQYDIRIEKLLDVQANAYRTKLIEQSYNCIFPILGG